MKTEPSHPIKVVSGRTGLSQHLIRAWETRYGAVRPKRTPTNRRLYSDADVERLRLLKKATEGGRGISHVASLSNEELAMLIAGDAPPRGEGLPAVRLSRDPASGPHFERCLEEVHRLDARGLEAALLQASVAMPATSLIEDLILPLMLTMGELWQHGKLRAAHEHLASGIIRTFLGNMLSGFVSEPSAPALIVTTPAGQVHEFGALAAAATAAAEGWRVDYLGANLPAEEIAAATAQKGVRVIALSLVYPTDDFHMHKELHRLRKLLPESTEILAGGRATPAYADALRSIGAHRVGSMSDLKQRLRAFRARAGDRKA